MPVENRCITGNAVLGLRAKTCLIGIRAYLESDGKMQISRNATPGNLRNIATEFTGIEYARSRKGLEMAYRDLSKLMENKNLDEIGETREVNKIVGGVAADLTND